MHQVFEEYLLLLGSHVLRDNLDDKVLAVRKPDAIEADLLEDRVIVLNLRKDLVLALKFL